MSMFYCAWHHKVEDSDVVGFVSDEEGNEFCEDAMGEYEDEVEYRYPVDGEGEVLAAINNLTDEELKEILGD